MKNTIPYSSPSSSEEVEESKKELEEEEGEQMMAVELFDQSKITSSSSITIKPNLLSMAASGPSHRSTRSCSEKRSLTDQSKTRASAMERAEEVQANLEPQCPSFVKSMHPSHVSGEFRLGIPANFGKHLPKQITIMNLIDEEEHVYLVKYLPSKIAFSLGWKDFCIRHKLGDGDALVFQLVESTKFQVYIVRAYAMAAVEGVIGRQNEDARRKDIQSCKRAKTSENTGERGQNSLALVALEQPEGSRSRSYSEGVGSEIKEGIRILETRLDFKDVQTLGRFTIAVNGLIMDSKFSEEERSKYYELCCRQEAFLHENLLRTITSELAASVISETISIAESIRASKLTTSRENFAAWDTTLEAFERLGMNVGFLRAKIKKLVSLVLKSDEGAISKRFREAIAKRDNMQEEIKALKSKVVELEEASKGLNTEIETLTLEVEHNELQFKAEVQATW